MKKIALIAGLLLTTNAAWAAETDWVEVGPDSYIRLITSDVLLNGKTKVALELKMPANTKTYWRIPGETGIPTQIELAASKNVTSSEIIWPYPMRDNKDGYVDFVYYGPTVLPISLEVADADASLSMEVLMGVCDEICIPVQADFDLPLTFDQPDRGHDFRIKQAVNQAPIAWDMETEPFGEILFDPEPGRLSVEIDPAIINPATLIIDNGDPGLLFAMPQKSPDGRLVTFDILGRATTENLHKAPVRLTFLTNEGAYEVSREVKLAP